MSNYEVNKATLIFDPHQDHVWVDSIIQRESDDSDLIIIGGDLFDTFNLKFKDVKKSLSYFLSLKRSLGDKIQFLIGNHDIHYYYHFLKSGKRKRYTLDNNPHLCSGYSKNTQHIVAELVSEEFIRSSKLAIGVNGYLVSHAGFLPDDRIPTTDLQTLLDFVASEWSRFPDDSFLYSCGMFRGGRSTFGGPLWCDFYKEFVCQLPWPQIVGHTTHRGAPWRVYSKLPGGRRDNHSYCVDCLQTVYAVVGDDKIQFKDATKDFAEVAPWDLD